MWRACKNLGIHTSNSLVSLVNTAKIVPIIAAGGIRNGVDMAKAIALGPSYVGTALPLLAPAMESEEAVKKKIEKIVHEFRRAMFCCCKGNPNDLKIGDCIQEVRRSSRIRKPWMGRASC